MQPTSGVICTERPDRAAALLRQAERAALDGALEEARELLDSAWALAAAPELASRAAWELALLHARMGAYAEAARWFSKISLPPTGESPLWHESRQALIELCSRAQRPDPPSSAAAPLQIISLGHFQIMRAGIALPPCRMHHAVAILRYLLSRRRRTAHKEELMELFWPDVTPNRAAHSLHVAVSALRGYMNHGAYNYLIFTGGHYLINPDAEVGDDSATFEQLCERGDQRRGAGDEVGAQRDYAAAVALYQGDYAADEHDLPWVIARRERLLARYLAALDGLGQIYIAQRSFGAAVDCYQRLLERDEYREDAHYQIIRCYLQLDRRHEARRQYERCAAVLASDLGIEPVPALRELMVGGGAV